MEQNQKVSASPLNDFLFGKAKQMAIPLSGTFELTPTCNLACKMCYVRKTPAEVASSPRPQMKMEQWIRLAEEACDMGMLHVLLTGGEPTLWPDFWTLYSELVQMGILVAVNTNGSRLDEAAVEAFVKQPPRRVNITLYGASDETYGNLCGNNHVYSKVDYAIRELKQAGIQVKLNCSLTPWNVHDLEKMVAYSEELGVVLDVAAYMFPPLRRDASMVGRNERFTAEETARYRLLAYKLQHGEQAYQEYLTGILHGSVPPPGLDESCVDPLDGSIKCNAGKACFWTTWDGFMHPCGMMTEPKVDMTGRSFAECWQDINKQSLDLKLSGVCSSCKNILLCHSCAAMAQTETGQVSGIPTFLCEMVEAMKKIAEAETK